MAALNAAAPQTLERCLADLTSLQQELEKMTARVPRCRGTKEDLRRAVAEPVLVIKGKQAGRDGTS